MKAAVYYGPGNMRYQDIPDPKCKPEGVIVKLHSCGVCHVMDIDAWNRWMPNSQGSGFARGHEWAGEIVEIGSKVKDFKVGDRIFQNPVFRPCHRCSYCIEEDYWRCQNWKEGFAQVAIHGGFAEYIEIPFITDESATIMPNDVTWNDLSMIEPMYLGIGIGKKGRPGQTALVIGMELTGVTVVAKLHQMGCKVIAADVSDKRLKAAGEVGADILVNSLEQDVVREALKGTKAHGVDHVMLFDTRPVGLTQAIGSLKRSGMIWLCGSYRTPFKLRADLDKVNQEAWFGPGAGLTDPPVQWDPALLHMQVAWGGLGPRVPRWIEAAKMIQSGLITAEKYVTATFPLSKTAEAFDLTAEDHDQIKVVVEI